MADTVRTSAEVLALLANNTTQAISPQDLRDTVVSLFGNHAGLYVHSGTTAQTGVSTSTLLTCFSVDGADGVESGCLTLDRANDKITASVDGVYAVFFQCGFSGSVATEYHFHAQKNGSTHMNELGTHRKIGTGGDVGSCSMLALVTLSANDFLQIYVEADSSANVTVEDAQFYMMKVA